MIVKAVEAPTNLVQPAEHGATPPPVFRDDNITVYSIPLYPDTVAPAAEQSSPRPLKRKRSPSPPTSSKRLSPPPATDHTVESNSPVSSALTVHAKAKDFNPSTLTGLEAQEWRKLLLQIMFPMQAPPEADTSLTKRAKREAREALLQAARDPSLRNRVNSGSGKHLRLPCLAAGDGSDPPALPTLAYLCVGPSVRGKFDVKKAEALGVPRGPIRGQLTKGETVTFEVDDGNGGKIQRTVKPDDCVGPSEAPQVWWSWLVSSSTY